MKLYNYILRNLETFQSKVGIQLSIKQNEEARVLDQ